MTSAKDTSPAMRWLENTLLYILLGLIVLRTTIIETPHIDQFQTRLFLSSEIVSLLISSVLLVCIGLWFLVSFLRGQFRWRKTGFGIAVGVFVFAGILVACFASDKRAAVTDIITLAMPMLAGVLLVQLLTSAVKIRLALLLILAVGVAATVLCLMQVSFFNDDMVKNYEENPSEFLARQGVVVGGVEQFMYEHRLYSKDIPGFLITSNSAASFFLLSVFAAMGLCVESFWEYKNQKAWKDREQVLVALICYTLGFMFIVFGLFLTQSKGGIGAFILGLGLFVILCAFGKAIWKRRLLFGVLLLLLVVIATGFIIHYGTQHGRLPGGNSMLVRWQYWQSAAAMIRDHIATGVGGGNFPQLYMHYKIPAASETVQNPHNWILSLLSQYGPLGLIAFLAAIFLPLYKVFGRCCGDTHLSDGSSQPDRSNIWIGLLAVSAVMLLFVRPALVDTEFLYQRVDVRSAAYVVLYLIPAAVFIFAFILLRAASLGDKSLGGRSDRMAIALMCGLVAVLVHNLIDFAIFEPGVFGVLWLFIAILAAQMHNQTDAPDNVPVLEVPKRLGAVAGLVIFGLVYLSVVLLPPIHAEWYFKQAMGDDIRRIELIKKAIAADSLSSKTAYQAAGMFKQVYQQQPNKDKRFLEKAFDFAHIAAERNPADFKPWRLLSEIEILLAEQAEGEQKEKYLQMAFDSIQQAIKRYPGSGKLHYDRASIAEQLGRNKIALAQYQMAVEIEDAYRAQFRIMYPDRETVISRLGEMNYAEAKSRVDALQKNDQ